jgi:alginate O-acetyltransferase complex protein AlgJ
VSVFEVVRGEPSGAGLLGDAPEHGITLMGSSYSAEWTQFPAALRSALQRDVFSLSITADQGQWAGMESYLRDDAFQTHRPALLIWEMPERDMKSPPAMPYREARYVMGNQEWLLRAAAWVQQECAASPATLAIEASGLAKGSKPAQLASGLRSGASQANDFFELRFTPALERLDYLSARITSKGSTTWRMEASGPGAVTRRWTQTVAGDDAEHALKLPIAVGPEGQAFTRLKIFPGRTSGLAFQGASLCKQPASLLE